MFCFLALKFLYLTIRKITHSKTTQKSFQPKVNIYKIVLFKVLKVFLHTFQSAVYEHLFGIKIVLFVAFV